MAHRSNPTDRSLDGYTVREAFGGDASSIVELQNRLGEEDEFLLVAPVDPVNGVPLLKASLGGHAPADGTRIFVAEENAAIVGLVLCRNHLHPALDGTVQITLCVDGAHRRRGLGTALLRHAVAWSEQAGVRRLQLAVVAANDAAVATYRKSGFVIEGTLRDAVVVGGDRHDLHIMARQIAQAAH